MIRAGILICVVATVASLPVDQGYTINVDGPDGRHVQMGEPGKAVSGYFTSRSLDGQMEYKTMYEADDKGFRVRGDHLPSTSAVAGVRSLENEPSYVFNYDARSHSHYQMGEPGKAVQGSFMYYDAQGRSQRVDYEADENGYRVKPAVEDKPIEISSGSDAEVVKAADPVAEVAKQETVEPVPAVAAEPVAAEPLPAAPAGTYFIAPEVAIKPADPIKVESDPVQVEAEPLPKIESKPIKESNDQAKVITVPFPFPGAAFYRGALPYAQPVYSFSPYSYGYGYSYGYPFTQGNYVYAL